MAHKDYKPMVKRGVWLEKFLKTDLRWMGYKDLVKEFLDIYQVEFELSDKDTSIQFFKILDEYPDFINILKMHPMEPSLKDRYGKIFEKFEVSFSQKDLTGIENLFETKRVIRKAFQNICDNPKPWDYHFAKSNVYDLDQWDSKHFSLLSLIRYYNGLVERLTTTRHGLTKGTTFASEFDNIDPLTEALNKGDLPRLRLSSFPWEVAGSRMFFDFLYKGGQEYFLFCPQCGNFVTILRHGKKKFCSDICKTRFRIANLK